MGSRIGYCTKDKLGRSNILRKQWMSSVEEGVIKMWNTLGGNPGNGSQAIRDDLDNGRAFAACVISFYSPPFDSIEIDTKCDIADNGLIEINVTNWKKWIITHYEIGWKEGQEGNLLESKQIAEMDSKGFKWLVTKTQREKMGEGLF